MKRCPECRRDYYDDTLLYCLDDGRALLDGPASSGESATAILDSVELRQSPTVSNEPEPSSVLPADAAKTGNERQSIERLDSRQRSKQWIIAVVGLAVALIAAGFFAFIWFGQPSPSTVPFQNMRATSVSDWDDSLSPTISPDAKYIVFTTDDGAGNFNLKLRQIATSSTIDLLPPRPGRILGMEFSRDGNYIYYGYVAKNTSLAKLFRIPTLGTGAAPREILSDLAGPLSFSPDGKRVAFTRYIPENNSHAIMTASSEGGDSQLLINSTQTEYTWLDAPAWSPDGSKILAFAALQNQGEIDERIIEIAMPEGSHKPINIKKFGTIRDFRWLSDGSGLIVNAIETSNPLSQIWHVAYPSGTTKRITNDANDYSWLSLSSDNRVLAVLKIEPRAAVTSFDLRTRESKKLTTDFPVEHRSLDNLGLMPNGKIIFVRPKELGIYNFWVMNADGKDLKTIGADIPLTGTPSVTSDERYIVFSSIKSGTYKICRSDINGNNIVQLTDGKDETDFSPQVTVDGQTILFHRLNEKTRKVWLMKMSIDGNDVAMIGYDAEGLQISPDSKRAAYYLKDADSKRGFLHVAPFDGVSIGASTKLIEMEQVVIRWTPDGKFVTYVDRKNVENLWKVSPDGDKPIQVTSFASGRISDFQWSRDGSQLFITRTSVESELILIRDEGSK